MWQPVAEAEALVVLAESTQHIAFSNTDRGLAGGDATLNRT